MVCLGEPHAAVCAGPPAPRQPGAADGAVAAGLGGTPGVEADGRVVEVSGDAVTPEIQRVGRWFYEVRLHIQPADTWIGVSTEPPSLVLGLRWARWKARRLMAAEMRRQR